MEETLEQRIEKLEKRVAALEGQVQEQPKNITIKSSNAKSTTEVASQNYHPLSSRFYH